MQWCEVPVFKSKYPAIKNSPKKTVAQRKISLASLFSVYINMTEEERMKLYKETRGVVEGGGHITQLHWIIQSILNRWHLVLSCAHPQSCLTLCDPMDCSSSNHRVFQAKILEWIAISLTTGSSQPRDGTQVSSSPALQVGSLPIEPSGKPPIGGIFILQSMCNMTFILF